MFTEHLSERFEEYHHAMRNPPVIPQCIVNSLNDHLDEDIIVGIQQVPFLHATLANQIKATISIVNDTKKKIKIEGLQ